MAAEGKMTALTRFGPSKRGRRATCESMHEQSLNIPIIVRVMCENGDTESGAEGVAAVYKRDGDRLDAELSNRDDAMARETVLRCVEGVTTPAGR